MADLTKLVFHSSYKAFKNNRIYAGSFNISGSVGGGINIRTHTVSLDQAPVLVDVLFNGPTNEYIRRPAGGWTRWGEVAVPVSYPDTATDTTIWVISYRVSGSNLIFTAYNVQQFDETGTLTSTPVNYRIVDYSVA